MRISESILETKARFRLIAPIGMVAYPVWAYVMLWIYPASKESILQRMLVAAYIGFTLFAAEMWARSARQVHVLFLSCMWAISLHYLYLVYVNLLSWHYVAAAFITLTAVFGTIRGLVASFAYAFGMIAAASIVAFLGMDMNLEGSRVLFFGVITNFIVLMAVQIQRETMFGAHAKSEHRYRTMLANLSEGVILQDLSGEIQTFNSSACGILGLTADKLVGLKVSDLCGHAVTLTGEPVLFDRYPSQLAIETGDPQENFVMGVTLNGRQRWLRINAQPLYAEGELSPAGVVTSFSDITEEILNHRQLVEQQAMLAHAMKMSSLGEMAAGIAHEVNNPLAIIDGRVRQLKRMVELKDWNQQKMLELTEKVNQTVQRISKIVKGLRSLSRESSQDPFEAASPAQIVEETLVVCRERFAQNGVELKVDSLNADLRIDCRPTQISQVLLNLLGNAFDAVEGSEVSWVALRSEVVGDRLKIIVSDSGPGISAELREKIMQPFFTTKEIGKGTGLGLSISRSILDKHGGSLTLDSSQPHTTFVIELPMTSKTGLPRPATSTEQKAA